MPTLVNGQNWSGTGNGKVVGSYWSDVAYLHIDCSGNSASATLECSPDGSTRWMTVTSWAMGANTTATAQIAAFFPWLRGGVIWASGGTNTGKVTMTYQGRMQGV